jgi:hypothetical protein
LATELPSLKIGKPVVAWYQDEVMRLRTIHGPQATGPLDWAMFERQFLGVQEQVHA